MTLHLHHAWWVAAYGGIWLLTGIQLMTWFWVLTCSRMRLAGTYVQAAVSSCYLMTLKFIVPVQVAAAGGWSVTGPHGASEALDATVHPQQGDGMFCNEFGL